MLFKLSMRNIKRSFKDYWIYFLTLVFSISVFYTFNSVKSQQIMMSLSEEKKKMFDSLDFTLGIFSVLISIVLAFLIIYANKFLIRRRKKEFGIYMTLGMNKSSISKILCLETILIGILSLVVGIFLGGILSQALAMVTAKLFQTQINEFRFVFSRVAFYRTLICFGVINLLVLIFNSISIGKIKLIDLLNANKKNDKIVNRNTILNAILFLISLAFIGSGYFIVLKAGIAVLDGTLALAILLGTIGTLLFFYALSGFMLKLLMKDKKRYFKNINMFILRQISSKINTTFISISFVCLMIFFSICILSAGFGVSQGVNSDIKDLTRFATSIEIFRGDNSEKHFNKINSMVKSDKLNTLEFEYFDTGIGIRDLLGEECYKKNKSYYPLKVNQKIDAIKVSDYNKIQKELNGEEINLKSDEYAVFNDITALKDEVEKVYNTKDLEVFGKKIHKSNSKCIQNTIENSANKRNNATIILPDQMLKDQKYNTKIINILSNEDATELNNKLNSYFEEINPNAQNIQFRFTTKEDVEGIAMGTGAMASYIAIYIGVIFLIVSAAILAIQQLTETSDNVERYNLLRKIGVSNKRIKKSIFTQILLYFMLPLSIAIIHCIPGLKLSKDIIELLGNGDANFVISITIVLILLIYGAYFVSTFVGSLKIYKSQEN